MQQVRAGYLEWQGGLRQRVLRHLHTLDARFKTEEKQREGRVQEERERLQQLRLATDGSAIAAAPVAAGNTILVVTRNGGLFALRPQ